MKAAVFKGAGKLLSLEEVPDPTPGPDELVLKVGRCGICGTDLHRTEGHPGETYPLGYVMGHEFAGDVVARGSAVKRIKIGDRVTALPFRGCGSCAACRAGDVFYCENGIRPMQGGFAEYVCVGARESIRLPAALSLADGALVEPLAVGHHAVELSGMEPGARVLVIGAGPIGLAAIYWARRHGAASILVLARSRRRESIAIAMGATRFMESGEAPTQETEAALGGAPDVVFEAVGLPGLIAQSINYARPRGTVVILGLCLAPDSFAPALAMRKEVRLLFSMAYGITSFRDSIDALEVGHVEPRAMITGTVSLDALPGAFESLRSPSHQCKLIVDPWED